MMHRPLLCFVLVLLLAPLVFLCFASLPAGLALGFGLARAQTTSTITVNITLNPAAGSNAVSVGNYFTVSYINSSGKPATAEYVGKPLSLQVESGTQVNLSATSSMSSKSEEWCFWKSGGVCMPVTFKPTSSTSVKYFYYDLLSFDVMYSVVGGGTGYSAPQLTYTTAPSQPTTSSSPATLTITLSSTTPQLIWALRGSVISVPQTLAGSGSLQRWATNTTSWVVGVTTPPPSNIVYYNQYLVYLTPTVSAGSLASNPASVYYTQFGGVANTALSYPVDVWVDAGGSLGWVASTSGGGVNTQYSATLFTYGLVGYWPLSEGVGNAVFDLSGQGNTGHTASPAVWLQGSPCLLSSCLDFNGVNQYVVAGSNSIPTGSGSFTKVVWVYLPYGLTTSEEDRAILCWGSTAYVGFENCLATGGGPDQLVNTFNGIRFTWNATNIVDGWNLIVVTYNGSVEEGYVNGVLEASAKVGPAFVQSSPVYIGWFPTFNYFNYPIQDVRVYDYAWSQEQVSEYYATAIPQLEFRVTYPGESLSMEYYEQYRESVWYSVLDGVSPSAPYITFSALGRSFSVQLTTAPETLWMDAATTYSVTNPITTVTMGVRWVTNQTQFTVAKPGLIHIYYFTQDLLSVGYSVVGGGSGYTPPTFNYTSAGKPQSVTLGSTPTQLWADNTTRWSVSLELAGSSATQRWMGDFNSTGVVEAPTTLKFTYYHQYSVRFSYTVVGGGSGYTPPKVLYEAFGANTTTPAGVYVWADANTPYTYTDPLAGSTATQRWYSPEVSGSVTGPGVINATYYHQYLLTISYLVVGGGTPPTPTATFTEFGVNTTLNIQPNGTQVWVDSGGVYMAQRILTYPTIPSVRWASPTQVAGTATSPVSVRVTYYHQYLLTVYYTVVGGGVPPAPTMNATQFGSTVTFTLQPNGSEVWVDSGGQYIIEQILTGGQTGERWASKTPVTGTVTLPATVNTTYYHQYLLTISYLVVGGGTPPTPTVNATQFGTTVSLNIEQGGSKIWVDSGGSYVTPQVLPGTTGERWASPTPIAGTMSAPVSITLTYYHEFYVQLSVNAQPAGSVTPTSGWYNASSTITLSAKASPGWVFEEWVGSGSASYSGRQPTVSLVVTSPLSEMAVFYAELNISVQTGGSVMYSYDNTTGTVGGGSSITLYVPPGVKVLLAEKPIPILYLAQGFTHNGVTLSTNTSITVSGPLVVTALFQINYPAIVVIALVVVAVVVAAAVALTVRHRGGRPPPPPPPP